MREAEITETSGLIFLSDLQGIRGRTGQTVTCDLARASYQSFSEPYSKYVAFLDNPRDGMCKNSKVEYMPTLKPKHPISSCSLLLWEVIIAYAFLPVAGLSATTS